MTTTKQQAIPTEEINWDGADQSAQDAMSLQLPLVLWRHGKLQMKQLGDKNMNYTGGFFLNQDDAGQDTAIELWSAQSFQGDDGEVLGLAAASADVAFIRSRRRWFKDTDGRLEFRAWNRYEPTFRGHLQIVGFIKGFEHPVTFNFKGLLGQYIESIQREHASKVVSLINRTAPKGKGVPGYALWVRVKAGKHEKVGSGNQQSEVTMPLIGLPPNVDLAFAKTRFVGNALLQRMQELYIEAADWSREWDYAGSVGMDNRTATGTSRPSADPAINDPYGDYSPQSAPADDDQVPF